jgi:hypothetical protein
VQFGKFSSLHFAIPTQGGISLCASYGVDLKQVALNQGSSFTSVQDDILGGVEQIFDTPPARF